MMLDDRRLELDLYSTALRGFVDPDSFGLSRVAQFEYNVSNPDLKSDFAGYTWELLDKCSKA